MLQVSTTIAAKVALKPGDERLLHEQDIFELLDQIGCPQIVQSFLHRVDITFLELIANGTLHDQIRIIK